ncbi:hypothetical protein RB195_006416 [Necator americanus]|uniref:Uncharacterized protein n=1 Tax=Necator americanus TaxID=51031 RepID=A0ABR1BSI0_NECAM
MHEFPSHVPTQDDNFKSSARSSGRKEPTGCPDSELYRRRVEIIAEGIPMGFRHGSESKVEGNVTRRRWDPFHERIGGEE